MWSSVQPSHFVSKLNLPGQASFLASKSLHTSFVVKVESRWKLSSTVACESHRWERKQRESRVAKPAAFNSPVNVRLLTPTVATKCGAVTKFSCSPNPRENGWNKHTSRDKIDENPFEDGDLRRYHHGSVKSLTVSTPSKAITPPKRRSSTNTRRSFPMTSKEAKEVAQRAIQFAKETFERKVTTKLPSTPKPKHALAKATKVGENTEKFDSLKMKLAAWFSDAPPSSVMLQSPSINRSMPLIFRDESENISPIGSVDSHDDVASFVLPENFPEDVDPTTPLATEALDTIIVDDKVNFPLDCWLDAPTIDQLDCSPRHLMIERKVDENVSAMSDKAVLAESTVATEKASLNEKVRSFYFEERNHQESDEDADTVVGENENIGHAVIV